MMNTEFRTKVRNDFQKELYKLMNNSVFGKTIENLAKLSSSQQGDEQDKEVNSQPIVQQACNIYDQCGRNQHTKKEAGS